MNSITVSKDVTSVKQHMGKLGAHKSELFSFLFSINFLVHAAILSGLVHGFALLYGILKMHLNKLQKLQNSAARLITGHSTATTLPYEICTGFQYVLE